MLQFFMLRFKNCILTRIELIDWGSYNSIWIELRYSFFLTWSMYNCTIRMLYYIGTSMLFICKAMWNDIEQFILSLVEPLIKKANWKQLTQGMQFCICYSKQEQSLLDRIARRCCCYKMLVTIQGAVKTWTSKILVQAADVGDLVIIK